MGDAKVDRYQKTANEISRRSMIKRIGAGAAIAWSAPVLTSLRLPAFAQATSGNCGTIADECRGRARCGDGPPPDSGCGPATNSCHCSDTVTGTCFCFNNQRCRDAIPCTTAAQCPAGWVCLSDTNGCHAQVCAAPCGTCPVLTSAEDPDMTIAGFIA